MSNDTGKWLPMNLDGSFHSCNQNQTQTGGQKKVVEKPLSIEDRLVRLKESCWIHGNDTTRRDPKWSGNCSEW